jgi:SpoVK/Ycf46/Vps4 family AAA+-type ATPase
MSQTFEHTDQKLLKFKELKVYSSTEWLADNKKKYRQVFDRFEVTYIYAELSFYNKMFDRENWKVDIDLRCYELKKNRKKLCSLNIKKQVSKFDSIVYVREGWGNKKEGAFWKSGTYYWEAWIDGKKVATKYFYIEDAGNNYSTLDNPYVDISSLKLYEGQYDDVIEAERIYHKAFSCEETRYIYVEIMLKNLVVHSNWHCELFIKFYNQARELKGQVNKLHNVKADDEFVKITAGWGTNVKGSWRHGNYTVEIIFMDKLLAVIPFEVGDEFVEGVIPVQLPNSTSPLLLVQDETINQSFEEVMADLTSLIGLTEIKDQVEDHSKYIQFLQLRKDKGFDENEEINIHSVFTGNPGTGKTTVAQMMGKLYKKMGLLSKGHVHEVDRVDLVGEYIGQTAPKVKDAIEKAKGGVLFIDEAYALARANDDSKDFGREVIEILVKEMSNKDREFAVIVAGYPNEMNHFIDSNPGLKSRFKLFYHFTDYMPQELSQIAEFAAAEMEVVFTEKAKVKIDEIITEAFRNRDKSFGNARFVYDLVEKSKINLGLRTMNQESPGALDTSSLETIILQDVENLKLERKIQKPHIPIDYELLDSAIGELNSLIGISKVKEQIKELIEIVKYYRESGKEVLHKFYLHTVFVGNPGTGKTTVARILTKVYKALGILERGHMVETDRQGLVAGYVGQTAIKTAEIIDEALGGVLFIDEAYALSGSSSGRGDFGNEAIQTILKRMEDHRGEFFVFAAGYPDNMEHFLKINPGLNSRFDKILKFDDYSPSDLCEIAKKMLSDESLNINKDAENLLSKELKTLHIQKDRYFGNARTVRTIVSDIIRFQNLRLASEKERNQESIHIIELEDVKKALDAKAEQVFQKSSIGFR